MWRTRSSPGGHLLSRSDARAQTTREHKQAHPSHHRPVGPATGATRTSGVTRSRTSSCRSVELSTYWPGRLPAAVRRPTAQRPRGRRSARRPARRPGRSAACSAGLPSRRQLRVRRGRARPRRNGRLPRGGPGVRRYRTRPAERVSVWARRCDQPLCLHQPSAQPRRRRPKGSTFAREYGFGEVCCRATCQSIEPIRVYARIPLGRRACHQPAPALTPPPHPRKALS